MNHLKYDEIDVLSHSLQEEKKKHHRGTKYLNLKSSGYMGIKKKKKILGWEGSLPVCPKPGILVSVGPK